MIQRMKQNVKNSYRLTDTMDIDDATRYCKTADEIMVTTQEQYHNPWIRGLYV